jgi:hypothetical protein
MTSNRGFSNLCLAHAVIAAAAGLVLVTNPPLIPGIVGIRIEKGAYVLLYLLAGAQFGIAALSYLGRNIRDHAAMRAVAVSCIVFHGSSALLELYALPLPGNRVIWANVVVRAVICFLFAYYGLWDRHAGAVMNRHTGGQ